jgi:predicted SnoaL-like aldol condensation-catalyzing enzyme
MHTPFQRFRRENIALACCVALALSACASSTPAPPKESANMTNAAQKQQMVDFLKSIETGDTGPLAYVGKYTQHNVGIPDGLAGLGAVLKQLPKGSARVSTARVFQDGDFVVTHTDYDFFGPKIGFDIFRLEDGKIAEHWDNLQAKPTAANPSGRSMIDGPSQVTDVEKTEANKALVSAFVEDVLLHGRMDALPKYCDGDRYLQHNPLVADGLSSLGAALSALAQQGKAIKYDRVHKVLGEGNFVLVVSEGTFGDSPTSYYDLFRVEGDKIAEHWDTIEAIPPRDQWKNDNGKF